MGGEITERPRASGIAIEAPDLLVGVAPVLQVAAAKVTEVAEVARFDHHGPGARSERSGS